MFSVLQPLFCLPCRPDDDPPPIPLKKRRAQHGVLEKALPSSLPPSVNCAKVLFSYDANQPDELTLRPGQVRGVV